MRHLRRYRDSGLGGGLGGDPRRRRVPQEEAEAQGAQGWGTRAPRRGFRGKAALRRRIRGGPAPGTERLMARYLVTSALPYANGPLHLGHLAGAYLPADIYVRYLRMKGEDVLYVCGTDEHGVPITIAAEKAGK